MPKHCYKERRFAYRSLTIIGQANSIIEEYVAQGFDLTLRQLYYQFVARDLFPDDRRWTWDRVRNKWRCDPKGTKNAEPNYKWLGSKINDARLAGLIGSILWIAPETCVAFPIGIPPLGYLEVLLNPTE